MKLEVSETARECRLEAPCTLSVVPRETAPVVVTLVSVDGAVTSIPFRLVAPLTERDARDDNPVTPRVALTVTAPDDERDETEVAPVTESAPVTAASPPKTELSVT